VYICSCVHVLCVCVCVCVQAVGVLIEQKLHARLEIPTALKAPVFRDVTSIQCARSSQRFEAQCQTV
jgi:hypothetical protein